MDKNKKEQEPVDSQERVQFKNGIVLGLMLPLFVPETPVLCRVDEIILMLYLCTMLSCLDVTNGEVLPCIMHS